MSIKFDTSGYEFTHGKKPSGRGSWAFKPYKKDILWVHDELFSVAKKKITKHLHNQEIYFTDVEILA